MAQARISSTEPPPRQTQHHDSSSSKHASEADHDLPSHPPEQSTTTTSSTSSTTPFPTSLSQLLPPTTTPLYKTLRLLRRQTLSVLPRLRSIYVDSQYIASLHAETGGLPMVANERCGGWYIPPSLKVRDGKGRSGSGSGSVYFKSTDGHYGQWGFSLRRVNLGGWIDAMGERGGVVVVDSTRRGKSWSDALRRTVPIWVGVVNAVCFGGKGAEEEEEGWLQSPQGEEGVGASERAQIEGRLEGWCRGLRELGVDVGELRARLRRPIRCVWVCHGGRGLEEGWRGDGTENVLVLASASRRVRGAEVSEGRYVQGAGDDSEGWARGLTSELWWENWERLLGATEEEVEGMIDEIVATEKDKLGSSQGQLVKIEKAGKLFVGTGSMANAERWDLVINCQGQGEDGKYMLYLGCREGKLGSKDLREKLASVKAIAEPLLQRKPECCMLVTCSTGRDLSIGVALMLLCLFFDEIDRSGPVIPPTRSDVWAGKADPSKLSSSVDKLFIKQRLAWITASKPDANPSRATLQAVNAFLIDRPS